ncbi:MAG: hypothetical protein L6V95_13235 [Candidatus Melainabacteria bacterium]|nr:MAG: hypothetical protein L6V95_13235 [Candidatus Melainabacteria bacterium]
MQEGLIIFIILTSLLNLSLFFNPYVPMLLGVDGQKMGKSFNNDIKISDDDKTTEEKNIKSNYRPKSNEKKQIVATLKTAKSLLNIMKHLLKIILNC